MDEELYAAAQAVRARAHAPYSNFAVGAAIRTEAGTVHVGCNVENASYPEGWCGETSAIAAMVSASEPGAGRVIAEITVVAKLIAGRLTTPCGGCRQRLAEFGRAGTLVHCVDPEGVLARSFRLDELLPEAFVLGDAS